MLSNYATDIDAPTMLREKFVLKFGLGHSCDHTRASVTADVTADCQEIYYQYRIVILCYGYTSIP